MFGEIYKLQTENIRLQRELATAQGDLARELSKRRECCPCPCELEPAVLFQVKRRHGTELAWENLGYTNNLSIALSYQDNARRGQVWITVHRGFIDKNGRVYNAQRVIVDSVPCEYRP